MTIYYSVIISYTSIEVVNTLTSHSFRSLEEYAFTWFAIITTYLIIAPSFIHYTMSIKRWRYLLNLWGIIRFILDVIIVSVYVGLSLTLCNPTNFMLFVFLIFYLYMVWDMIRTYEYKKGGAPDKTVQELSNRESINYFFVAVIYTLFLLIVTLESVVVTAILLIAVATVQVVYRITKMKTYFK